MREAHPREQAVGIEYYVSDADGTGGQLREAPEDFRVREIEAIDPEPLDADPAVYRHLLVRATLRDWDTNGFAGELSNRLGISRERVSWAGTKDAHAHTTQLFSIDGVDPADLPDLPDAEMEPVGRFGRRLYLGDLASNAFEVAVADPGAPGNTAAITDELRAFSGFAEGSGDDERVGCETRVAVPNYFGQQRFGSRRPVTHEVGLAIVRDDWKDAVLRYVGNPSDAEPEDSQAARAYAAETEDWSGALDRMPDRLGYERAMLHALVERGGDDPADFRAALDAVPENLQRLFVNAAQSYAFNRILSRRLERGLPFDRALEGDVVCFAETTAIAGDRDGGEVVVPDADRAQRVTENRVRSVNRHVDRGRAFVTAPLVGTESDLAGGDQGAIEREVLDEIGLEPADFDLPDPYGTTGTRRAIAVTTILAVARDPLSFSFSLPKGSYATVLLREYLKVDPESL
ncbi:MAG: tRNA pseudouridine(13) synthase TruD [Halobacteriales archaeon]